MDPHELIKRDDDLAYGRCRTCGEPIRFPVLTNHWTHQKPLLNLHFPHHKPEPIPDSITRRGEDF